MKIFDEQGKLYPLNTLLIYNDSRGNCHPCVLLSTRTVHLLSKNDLLHISDIYNLVRVLKPYPGYLRGNI